MQPMEEEVNDGDIWNWLRGGTGSTPINKLHVLLENVDGSGILSYLHDIGRSEGG